MQALPQILLWAIGLFGGAKMVEKTLEDFLMNQPWMPQGFKKYIVPIGSIISVVIASVYGGMNPADAFLLAIGVGGGASVIHDHPALTSGDWALPEPPADPLAVPGDK